MEATIGFRHGIWEKEINVSDFIKTNYTEYTGNETFLEGPTEATNQLHKERLQRIIQPSHSLFI